MGKKEKIINRALVKPVSEEGPLISASDLRKDLKKRSDIAEKTGCYKWWSPEEQVKKLLFKLGLEFSDVKSSLEKKEGLYCIYVGKANNLKSRIIRQHIIGGVSNSTLRKTIASVMKYYDNSKVDTNNNFIDYFKVQPIYLKKGELKDLEHSLINEKHGNTSYFRFLNSEDNKHEIALEVDLPQKITKARDKAKEKNPKVFLTSKEKKKLLK